jgi:hypothetical protein
MVHFFSSFAYTSKNWVVPQQNNPSFKDFTLQSATFHPRTKKIFYLGGQFSDYNSATLIRYPFTHAITFDTAKGQWDEEAIRGLDYPTLRLSHTATLRKLKKEPIIHPVNKDAVTHQFLTVKTSYYTAAPLMIVEQVYNLK